MPFTPEPAPDFWIYFASDRSPVGVYNADLDDYLADLAGEGLVEGVHFTVGGPF